MPRRPRRPGKAWTPEQRAAASLEARLRWEQTPPEVREARLARQRATYQARYPHRVRLYSKLKVRLEGGDLVPEPCDRCGGEGRMMLRFDDEDETVELLGWRCYPCRKMSQLASDG